jgi:hypothetical protein
LQQASREHETHLNRAASYLVGRGITEAAARTHHLGVVHDAEAVQQEGWLAGRLAIPYLTRAGVRTIRYRCLQEHDCAEHGHPKYASHSGHKPRLYNVEALFTVQPFLAVCEGEIDTMILNTLCGIPAVGVPGVSSWQDHWDRCVDQFDPILVFADGDKAGGQFADKLGRRLPQVQQITMPTGCDVNDVFLAEGAAGLRKRAGL